MFFGNRSKSRKSKRAGRRPTRGMIFEPLENRLALSTITWTNRGMASDNFDTVFGANATVARGVVDAVITSWQRVLLDLNQPGGGNSIDMTISMDPATPGFGAAASVTTFNAGYPTQGDITISSGTDTNGDGNGDGVGFFLDPTPLDWSEFAGTIQHAFTGDAQAGSPAAGISDFFTLVNAEITHVMGLFTAPAGIQTPLQGMVTNTGVVDDAEGGGIGTFFVFDGPNVTHLMTSNNGGAGGNNTGELVHSAGPPAGPNSPVSFTSAFRGTVNLQGVDDPGNAVYEFGRRYLVNDVFALIFQDSYGYQITLPQTFGTMYSFLNESTGEVLIRGSSGTDVVTTSVQGSEFVVSIDIGNDPAGSGPNGDASDIPAFISRFPLASVRSVRMQGFDGNDSFDIVPLVGVRIDIDGGNPPFPNGGVGDSLSVDLSGVQGIALVDNQDGSGSLSSTSHGQVTWISIEDLNVTGSGAGTVTGIKWNDLNADGVLDLREPGLGGVFVFVDINNDRQVGVGEPSTITGPDGRYTITGIPQGQFPVREIVPNGWTQTFPSTGSHLVDIIPGITVPNVDFGNAVVGGPNQGFDFGDAPDVYSTRMANNGPRHAILRGFGLGATVGGEADGLVDPAAALDPDEDAITFDTTDLAPGQAGTATVVVNSSFHSPGLVQGWIDFNRDGDFTDNGEQIIRDAQRSSGTYAFAFTTPAGAVAGTTYARFRYGYERGIGPAGAAVAGEVEDYRLSILALQPDARNDQFVVNQDVVNEPLDVLANDQRSAAGALTIRSVTNGNQGGTVAIAAGNLLLRYTPARGFIGTETFTYTVVDPAGRTDTATVTVTVRQASQSLIAVDDTFTLAVNEIRTLDVMANDLPGPNPPIKLLSFTNPANGRLRRDTRNTPEFTDDRLVYTPNAGFIGTDQFQYTVEDSSNPAGTNTATVTIQVAPQSSTDDVMEVLVRTENLAGQTVGDVRIGDEFFVVVSVDDLRAAPAAAGVFASFIDLLYDRSKISVVDDLNNPLGIDITFSSQYRSFNSADASVDGIINEVGGIQDFQNFPNALGPNPVELFRVRMRANSRGLAPIKADPGDISPAHDSLMFDPPTPVPARQIRFGEANLVVAQGTRPVAVDNSFAITLANPTNPQTTDLPVLANDIFAAADLPTIISVSTPANGTVSVFNNNTPNDPTDDLIRYRPNLGFNGTDQFTYTLQTLDGFTSTATVTIQITPGALNDDIANVRLVTTDLNGNTITSIAPGQQFQIRGFVDDLRCTPNPDGAVPPNAPACPTNREGVFALYLDLLYDRSLVTAGGVTFDAQYRNGISFDTSVAGIIDELGAFQTNQGPRGPGEVPFFTATFTANRAGLARFDGDPANIISPTNPAHDTLMFDPTTAVPISQIRFGSASLVIGSGTAPVAVDNSFNVPADATAFLDVMTNDIFATNDTRQIQAVQAPANGTAAVDDNGTPGNTADDRIRYRPNSGFTGSEQFTYTIRNQSGFTSTAEITVHVQPGSVNNDLVNVRLETTNIAGQTISSIAQGTDFVLQAFVSHRNAPPTGGVFAAYFDTLFDTARVSIGAGQTIMFATPFTNSQSGTTTTAGLLDEVGAFTGNFTPSGSAEQLLFTIRMRANSAGTANFIGDPADQLPAHDVLVFGSNIPVTFDQINFINKQLTITTNAAFMNPANPLDVNADQEVSPIDVLLVINELNGAGARTLNATPNAAEGETTPRRYIDTNGDNQLTPLDAVHIINYLNSRQSTRSTLAAEAEPASADDGQAFAPVLNHTPAPSAPTGSPLNHGNGGQNPPGRSSPFGWVYTRPAHATPAQYRLPSGDLESLIDELAHDRFVHDPARGADAAHPWGWL